MKAAPVIHRGLGLLRLPALLGLSLSTRRGLGCPCHHFWQYLLSREALHGRAKTRYNKL